MNPFRLRPPSFRTEVFATVPFPGHPEGIVVDRDTVYVGTHQDFSGGPGIPSHVFGYNRHGEMVADYTIDGQNRAGQGILGLAADRDGLIYILDRAPSRVITLNPRTGEQSLYAELPSGTDRTVSRARPETPAVPDDLVFAPDGSLYVTNLTQALIWRVPPGGGSAEIWYTAPDLHSLFGPNGIRFLDNGRTLLFAQSAHELHDPQEIPAAHGLLYTLEIRPDGKPGRRDILWEGTAGETPDGFAIGRSGRIYVALALASAIMILGPDGREITRFPTARDHPRIPLDLPAGVAFLGERILVTNQAYFSGPREHQAVLAINVRDREKPLFRPGIQRS